MGKKISGAPDRIARNQQDQWLARETGRKGAHCASMGYGEEWKRKWAYPEDVPSTHARKHGTPRRWTLRGFLTLAVFALLAFWVGVAMAVGQGCGFTTLRGADLARLGYPICEGEE